MTAPNSTACPRVTTDRFNAEICPRSFSVLVRPGMRLNQLRLRRGQAVLSDADLTALHADQPLVGGAAGADRSRSGFLGRSASCAGRSGRLSRARPHSGCDRSGPHRRLSRGRVLDELRTTEGRLILVPRRLLYPGQPRIGGDPRRYAAEMAPYLAMVGEFRVHYAGFFDPAFGIGDEGHGARGVPRGTLPRGALRAGTRPDCRPPGL